MALVRVTKIFNFEMSHALWNYDGPCSNMHGHSYKLFVTVIGQPIDDTKNPKNGMVIDFGSLKTIVKTEIVNKLDHAVVLADNSAHQKLTESEQMFDKLFITPYQPTCENLIIEFAEKIAPQLPENVTLHSLRLYETENSYAEWFADDNV